MPREMSREEMSREGGRARPLHGSLPRASLPRACVWLGIGLVGVSMLPRVQGRTYPLPAIHDHPVVENISLASPRRQLGHCLPSACGYCAACPTCDGTCTTCCPSGEEMRAESDAEMSGSDLITMGAFALLGTR